MPKPPFGHEAAADAESLGVDAVSAGTAACPSSSEAAVALTLTRSDIDPPNPRSQKMETLPVAWTHGHPLALAGPLLYAVDRENGTLVRIERASMQVVSVIKVGPTPEQVVVGPDGSAYVSVRQAAAVIKISPASATVSATFAAPVGPAGLALSPDGTQLYVAGQEQAIVALLDAQTGAELGRASTLARPTALVAHKSGILVVHESAGMLNLLATAIVGHTGSEPPPTAQAVPYSAVSIDNSCDNLSQDMHATRAVAAAPDGNMAGIWVAHVLADPGRANDALSAAAADCGTVAGQGPSSGTNAYGGHATCPHRPVEPALSQMLPFGTLTTPTTLPPVALPNSEKPLVNSLAQPSDVALHPTHHLAIISGMGSDNAMIVRTTQDAAPLGLLHAGQAPSGVAISPDGKMVYVLNRHGFSVSEFNISSLIDRTSVGPALEFQPTRAVSIGNDPLPQEARVGRHTFEFAGNSRLSKDGTFACATCHRDGGEDQMTWFIGAGARQTPALAGRISGTAPYNWKGTQPILQHNMVDTIHRMGGDGLTPTELSSLEAYLLVGLTPPPNPNLMSGVLNASQLKGQAIFNDPGVGCSGCHVPGSGTDGLQHDVGTASALDLQIAEIKAKHFGDATKIVLKFDTPTLKGLHSSAPYLHDGSAKTLGDVLDRTQATMGHTEFMADAQRQDLIAYLLTL